MTSSQTTPLRTNGHGPHHMAPHNGQHLLAGMAAAPTRREPHHPFNTSRVRYGRGWLSLGFGAAALSMFGLRRYGFPALAGMSVMSLASAAYLALFEPARPTLDRVTLRLKGLPAALDGLRVGHISDTHLGRPHSARNLAWAVERMSVERPELIALTGDFVSSSAAIPQIAALLRGLSAPLGVYAVPGNHDYWEGLADIQAALALHDIPLLFNEHRRLRWNGADLWLVGLDDLWDGRPDFDIALQGVPRGACKLLLAHSPDIADEAAAHGFAAQFSGHTHGGHMRLPLLGPIALPRHGWRYTIGSYTVGDLSLYVSRGLSGNPFRLLCRPEATLLTLRRA